MTRSGNPIEQHGLKDAVSTGISYSQQYEIYASLKAAGLDLWKYEQGLYPPWFVANVLVHWRMSKLIGVHEQDAIARKVKKK